MYDFQILLYSHIVKTLKNRGYKHTPKVQIIRGYIFSHSLQIIVFFPYGGTILFLNRFLIMSSFLLIVQ